MKNLTSFAVALLLTANFTQAQTTNFALDLDGVDDYGRFPKCQAFTGDEFTVEGWFKCGQSVTSQVILMAFQNIADLNANVTLEVRDNGLFRFNYRQVASAGGGEEVYSRSTVADGKWHHFAAVRTAQLRLILYIDAFPEAYLDGFQGNVLDAPIFEIGRNKYATSENLRQFAGNLDDLKIWTFTKTPCDVFSEYQHESSGLETGLYANYKFDIQSDTLFDCSPNKHHGTRFGPLAPNVKPQFSTDRPPLVDADCQVQFVGTHGDGLTATGDGVVVSLLPNPAGDFLEVGLSGAKALRAKIFTAAGAFVREFWLAGSKSRVDVSGLPTGAYLLQVDSPDRSQVEVFVKD